MDDRVPPRRDSHASSSHEPSLEAYAYEKCCDLVSTVLKLTSLKTENARSAKGPKLQGLRAEDVLAQSYPRAGNVGDLITADYKVLSEGCESRNNHRYAAVVQDLATQWIQSYPCKTRTSQETQKERCKSSSSRMGSLKIIYTDNSLEFGKACEDLSWNHCTSTPHRSETNGIAERAVRRVKDGTSAVLLQSGLDEHWWADSHGVQYLSAKHSRSLVWWENTIREDVLGETIFKDRSFRFVSLVEYHPFTAKDQSRIHQFGNKVLPGLFPRIRFIRGRNLERVTYWLQTLRSWKRWTHQKSTLKDSMQRRWHFPKKMEKLFSSRRRTNQTSWRRSGTENTHLDTGTSNSRRKSLLGESEASLSPPQDSLPDAGWA